MGGIEHVAKLVADKREKGAENELFYKALNQSLNATVYFRGGESILPSDQQRYTLCSITYPVIICNSFDNLYRVEIEPEGDPSKIRENFQLEVNYAFIDPNRQSRNEYFLIDILDFSLIDTFLKAIKEDSELIGHWHIFDRNSRGPM
jgi:hypothetical protein